MKKKKTFEIQCASASGHSATESVMPCPNCGEDVDTSEAEGHGTGTVVCPHCEKKFHPATLTIESKSADVPIARACLEAMKARGMNPTLDQIVETVRLEHGVILDRREVAMQIEGRRQGYSSTSARAHLASCAAAEASANVRNAAAGCNLNELHTTALEAHETAAKAHMDACIFHGKAGKWHSEKIKNAAVEISEPEDEETTEKDSD
jgi:hypothetical protein